MKKIKSVKLKKDIITPDGIIYAGTIGKQICEDYHFDNNYDNYYNQTDIEGKPDWFDISYEENYFKIDYKYNGFNKQLNGDGKMYNIMHNAREYHMRGRVGSQEYLEEKDEADIVFNYFSKLADYLNDKHGWKYKVGNPYFTLIASDFLLVSKISFIQSYELTFPCIKFCPFITIKELNETANPEMIERFIKLSGK